MPPKGKGKGRGKSSKSPKKVIAKRTRQPPSEEEDKDDDYELSDHDAVLSSNSDDSIHPTQWKSARPQQQQKKRRLLKVPTTVQRSEPIQTSTQEVLTQEDRASDEESDEIPSTQRTSSKSSKTRATPLKVTREQEIELAEWYQGHTVFYDKRHQDHSNKMKREGLIGDKAKEMGLDPGKLYVWFKNQRDRVNAMAKKIVKHSGDPDNDDDLHALTEREKQVYISFKFLREFIQPHRRSSKTAGLTQSQPQASNISNIPASQGRTSSIPASQGRRSSITASLGSPSSIPASQGCSSSSNSRRPLPSYISSDEDQQVTHLAENQPSLHEGSDIGRNVEVCCHFTIVK